MAVERAALNEAMCKLVSHLSFHRLMVTKFSKQILPKMPILSPEQQASKLREILQRKKWTIYQLASLQSHLEAHRLIMVEEICLEEICLLTLVMKVCTFRRRLLGLFLMYYVAI